MKILLFFFYLHSPIYHVFLLLSNQLVIQMRFLASFFQLFQFIKLVQKIVEMSYKKSILISLPSKLFNTYFYIKRTTYYGIVMLLLSQQINQQLENIIYNQNQMNRSNSTLIIWKRKHLVYIRLWRQSYKRLEQQSKIFCFCGQKS